MNFQGFSRLLAPDCRVNTPHLARILLAAMLMARGGLLLHPRHRNSGQCDARRLHFHHAAPRQRTEAVHVSKINLSNQSQSIKCRCGLFKQLRASKIEQDTVSDPRLVPVLPEWLICTRLLKDFKSLRPSLRRTHCTARLPPPSLYLTGPVVYRNGSPWSSLGRQQGGHRE